MVEITANEINKYYGLNHVLKGISFEIYSGERIGLLGKNGSGKTTLFKVITGEEVYERGNLFIASGKKIEILAQIPAFGEHDTVEDILYSSFKEIMLIHDEMKKIEGDADPDILMRYGRLMEEYERLGGYDTDTKIEKICTGMNINENMRKKLFNLLSGGEKTRVNLARILLRECDVLLLDEPTNHLDLSSVEWLEKFLCEFSGTILVISHDRTFLDHVIHRIIEINDGTAEDYEGNYSCYVEEKEKRFLSQSELFKQQQKKIRQLETAAKRLHDWAKQADNEALHKQAFAIEKRIERIDKVEKPIAEKKLTREFESGGYSAKEVVSVEAVSKSYGVKILLDHVNLSIHRNDRVALIGDNGCGKTTLLKLIMQEDLCDSGVVRISSNVRIAYMPQIVEFEDENMTVLEALRDVVLESENLLRKRLAGFRFTADDVWKKVGSLSGGEKSRLKLCILMQERVNFLVLDEPTNHLDIASREWIEEAVSHFNGTMLFISHDRFFLNKFATKIWEMRDGAIAEFDCNFENYLNKSIEIANQSTPVLEKRKSRKSASLEIKKVIKPDLTESMIHEAECELNEINTAIESDINKSVFENMNDLYAEKQRLEEKINELYTDWINNTD